MQNQHEVKSLTDILKANPEAQAYFRELRERGAQRWAQEAEDAPTCATCGGVGFVVPSNLPYDHPMFGKPLPCPALNCPALEAQRHQRYEQLCTLAQIPDEYKDLTLDSWRELFEVAPAFQVGKLHAYGAALAFIAARENRFMFRLSDASIIVGIDEPEFDTPPRNSIAFYGTFGVGKTSLAVCILRELIDVYRVNAVYLLIGDFFLALQERFEKKAEYEFGGEASDEAELMRLYQQAPVLVMDEFPLKPGRTDWWERVVYSLVNYRHIHHLPTIITTNFTFDELTESWGGMIGYRLHTMAQWIEIGGLEMRRRDRMWKAQP